MSGQSKMTDLERFTSLLDDAGVTYGLLQGEAGTRRPDSPESVTDVYLGDAPQRSPDLVEIKVGDRITEFEGYMSFFAIWRFDADGKLVAVGHYE